MKSTTACDDQFIAGEDLAAGDLVIRTPEGVLVKGKLYVKPPAPPAPPPKTYGVFVGDPNVGTERASFQKLQDPAVVYMAMLRGEIAKLTWRQMVHLSGPVPNTADEALVEITRLRSEVKGLKADIDRYIEINAELATELTKLREQKPVAWINLNKWTPSNWPRCVTPEEYEKERELLTKLTAVYAAPVPAPHKGATHCDDCGLTWLDDGLNPLGCPYCKTHASERNARRYLALRKVGVQVPGYDFVKFDWSLDAAADRLLEECSSQAQNGVGNEQH